MNGLLDPNELRRILKRADTGVATWREMDLVRAHIAALEKERDAALQRESEVAFALEKVRSERDAALVDNAALLQALLDVAELRLSGPTLAAMAAKLRAEPHPGAALLEAHRKALMRARNYSLDRVYERLGHCLADHPGALDLIASLMNEVGAMQELEECTDASCAKCRSGEPCH